MGVPVADGNETADDVLNIIREVINEANVDIPDIVPDSAQRIGKTFKSDEISTIIQSLFVFRHSVIVVGKMGKKVKLDMTKRYDLLKKGIDIANNHKEKVKFVYYDINCTFKIHPNIGKEYFYSSIIDKLEVLF